LIDAHRRLLAEGPRPIDFRTLSAVDLRVGDTALQVLLSALAAVGSSAVLHVAIDTMPLDALSVARIIVPNLEPLLAG
jgi:ribosomal protein S12 methylthiotransferase accessory factor